MFTKLCRCFGRKISAHLGVEFIGTAPHEGKFFSTIVDSRVIEERKVTVNGTGINYLKVGTGEHPVLLLPAALGTIWLHFKSQVEGLDRKKFTIVAWDPPGYGKSRPPDRTFPDDFFERDAVQACNLMKVLGYTRFSLIGYCDGGISSLMLASMFPDNVRRMVVTSTSAYITPKEMELIQFSRNLGNWPESVRDTFRIFYEDEYLQKILADWVDALLRIEEKRNGDFCKKYLSTIKCPTLIVHGRKDSITFVEHSIYLKEHIPGGKLKIMENAGHTLHITYPDQFNELVTQFLTE